MGNEWSNILPKSSQERKKPPHHRSHLHAVPVHKALLDVLAASVDGLQPLWCNVLSLVHTQADHWFLRFFFFFLSEQPQSSLWLFCYFHVLPLFPYHSLSGLFSLKGEHGTFKAQNHHSVCSAHKGESRTNGSAQLSTWKKGKTVLHPVSAGSQTHSSCFHWITSAARWPLHYYPESTTKVASGWNTSHEITCLVCITDPES